ncbi:MAG: tetratricopeptide repeat protein [Syntrophales bacterium]
MKKIILYLTCFSLFFPVVPLRAETKTFIREYTYEAGETDSKISCRAIALEQVKRLLLEELGTYVESVTVVRDYQVAKDEITILTAGLVQTTILDENWDGKEYWLKAKITADPDEVASSIEKLRNNQQLVKDLAEARDEASQALREIDDLQQKLAAAEATTENREEYKKAVNTLIATDWFEKGQYQTFSGNYQEALKAYDMVVVLRPNDAKVYSNRGAVYVQLGRYDSAMRDLNKAVSLNPQNRTTLYNRNLIYKKLQQTTPVKSPEKGVLPRRYDDRGQLKDREKRESADRLKGSQDRDKQSFLNKPSGRQLKERDEQLRKDRQLVQRKGFEDKYKQKEQREDLRKKREMEERKRKQKKRERFKPKPEDEKK